MSRHEDAERLGMRQEKVRKVVTKRRKQFGQALADSSSFMCHWSQSDAGSAIWCHRGADVRTEGWPNRTKSLCIDEHRQQQPRDGHSLQFALCHARCKLLGRGGGNLVASPTHRLPQF